MLAPVTTEGSFDVARGETLIRHQIVPTDEITEIGTRFIKLTRTADGYENTVPIPDRLQPFLNVMRAVVRGDASALSRYPATLTTTDAGWSLAIAPPQNDPLELFGCGDVLGGITLRMEGNEKRVITFVPPK